MSLEYPKTIVSGELKILALTASMTYSYIMIIIETPIFTRQLFPLSPTRNIACFRQPCWNDLMPEKSFLVVGDFVKCYGDWKGEVRVGVYE